MLKLMTIDDVVDARTLLEFTREKFGCPSFKSDEMKFFRMSKLFFAQNPEYTYRDLAKVVQWAKEMRKRPHSLHNIFNFTKDAYVAGILPARHDMDRQRITDAMYAALEIETDPEWRMTLMAPTTPLGRLRALERWEQERRPAPKAFDMPQDDFQQESLEF